MADVKLSLGQVNFTGWIIVQLRKTTAPGVVYASQSFPPPHPTTRNVVFTGVDTGDYYLDFRDSPDGIALGILYGPYEINVKEQIKSIEKRFYTVDGPRAIDPSSTVNPTILADPYLDGKELEGVFLESFRDLKPPLDEAGAPRLDKEYDPHTGGGIELLGGLTFQPGQTWIITVNYTQDIPVVNVASGGFGAVADITGNVTLNSSHYNRRLRCESSASSRQVITVPPLSGIPEGIPFKFMSNGGNQFQTKIVMSGGDLMKYFEWTPSELSFMKGESLIAEKRTINGVQYLELYDVHPNILSVLERFDAQMKNHPNVKPADGTLYDGDDWPRPWYWIKNFLPVNHFIVDDLLLGGGYVHPAGKEGLYVIHSTQKKFRVPNTQGWHKRHLKNYSTYGGDGTRTYDYPGGSQPQKMLEHYHEGLEGDDSSHTSSSSALTGSVRWLVNSVAGNHITIVNSKTGGVAEGKGAAEQTNSNIGDIDLIRF